MRIKPRKYQMGGPFAGLDSDTTDTYNPYYQEKEKTHQDYFDIQRAGSKVNISTPYQFDPQAGPQGGLLSMDDLGPEGSTKVTGLNDAMPANPDVVAENTAALNAPTKGNGIPWGKMGKNAMNMLPYASNLINAFRRIPKPSRPELEVPVSADLVNYDSDRVDMDRQFRGVVKGAENASANPSLANATRVGAFAKLLEGRSRVTQAESNSNSQIKNQTRALNATIGARNTERNNDFKDKLVQRTIAQQQHNAANIANFSDKVQMERRDRAMMDLEKDKLEIIPRVYKDSGVVDRNVLDLLKEQIAKQDKDRPYGRYGGNIKRMLKNRC
jgi:hypothetical protein